ncbi:hypothetical protein P9112_007301 [Eukaryota sp. TZLM1-RC]
MLSGSTGCSSRHRRCTPSSSPCRPRIESLPSQSHPSLSSTTLTNNIDREDGVEYISINLGHTLLLTCSGEVYGWGLNDKGQVLYNGPQTIKSPIKLPLTNVVTISAGFSHSLVLTSEGKLYGWGNNEFNQINLSEEESLPITLINIPFNIKKVYGGHLCSFALTPAGQVIKWGCGNLFESIIELNNIGLICSNADSIVAGDDGNNFFFFNDGEIVQLPITQYLIFRKLLNNSMVLTCMFLLIVDINGDIWKFDRGGKFFNNKPTKVPGLSNIVSISGHRLTCSAIDSSGNVFVWGWLSRISQFYKKQNDPILMETFINIEGVSVGETYLLAYNKNTVWAWGRNDKGQLGTGDLIDRPQPVKIFGSEILGGFHYPKQPLDRMFSGIIKLVYWEYLNYLQKLFGNHPYVKARFYTKCGISKRLAQFAQEVINVHPIQNKLFLKDPQDLNLNDNICDLQLRLSTGYNGPKVINTRIKKLDVYFDEVDYESQLFQIFLNLEAVKLGGNLSAFGRSFSINLPHLVHLHCLELDYPFHIKQLPTSLVKLALRAYDFEVTDLSYLTSLNELVLPRDISKKIFLGQIPLPQSIVRLETVLEEPVNVEIQLPNLKELIIYETIPINVTEQNFPSLKFIQLIRPNEENLLNSSLSPTNLANVGLIKSVHLTKNEYLVELSCFPWWIQYPSERFITCPKRR